MSVSLSSLDLISNYENLTYKTVKDGEKFKFSPVIDIPTNSYHKFDFDGSHGLALVDDESVRRVVMEMSKEEYMENCFEHKLLIPYTTTGVSNLGKSYLYHSGGAVDTLDSKLFKAMSLIKEFKIPGFYKPRLAYLLTANYSAVKDKFDDVKGVGMVLRHFSQSSGGNKSMEYVGRRLRCSVEAPHPIESDYRFKEIVRLIFVSKAYTRPLRKIVKAVKPLVEHMFKQVQMTDDAKEEMTNMIDGFFRVYFEGVIECINVIKDGKKRMPLKVAYPFTPMYELDDSSCEYYADFDESARGGMPSTDVMTDACTEFSELKRIPAFSVKYSNFNDYNHYLNNIVYGQPISIVDGNRSVDEARVISTKRVKKLWFDLKWTDHDRSVVVLHSEEDIETSRGPTFCEEGARSKVKSWEVCNGPIQVVNPNREFGIIVDEKKYRRDTSKLHNTIICIHNDVNVIVKETLRSLPSFGAAIVAFKVTGGAMEHDDTPELDGEMLSIKNRKTPIILFEDSDSEDEEVDACNLIIDGTDDEDESY